MKPNDEYRNALISASRVCGWTGGAFLALLTGACSDTSQTQATKSSTTTNMVEVDTSISSDATQNTAVETSRVSESDSRPTYVPPPPPPPLVIYKIDYSPFHVENFETGPDGTCPYKDFCSSGRFSHLECGVASPNQLTFCNGIGCRGGFDPETVKSFSVGSICPRYQERTIEVIPTQELPVGSTSNTSTGADTTGGPVGGDESETETETETGWAVRLDYDLDYESGDAYAEYLVALDAHILGPSGELGPMKDQTGGQQGTSITESPIDCVVFSLANPEMETTPGIQLTFQEGHKPDETTPAYILSDHFVVGAEWCTMVIPMAEFSPVKNGNDLDHNNLGSFNLGFNQEVFVERGEPLTGHVLLDDVYLGECKEAAKLPNRCAPVE